MTNGWQMAKTLYPQSFWSSLWKILTQWWKGLKVDLNYHSVWSTIPNWESKECILSDKGWSEKDLCLAWLEGWLVWLAVYGLADLDLTDWMVCCRSQNPTCSVHDFLSAGSLSYAALSILHCSEKGPYFKDQDLIGTFVQPPLPEWALTGY